MAAGEPTDRAGSRSPTTDWPPWIAFAALFAALVLAAVAGVLLDIPAALVFGAKVTGSHLSPGLSIADTLVQDVGFVLVAVYFAGLGGRAARSWQFGLRRPAVGWWAACGVILALLVTFIVVSVAWAEAVHPEKEKTLEQLGSKEGAALLVLSAGLTCVVAPMCEELLFRGLIFTALRNWRGTLPAAVITGLLFGGVHVGSAPALDLVPLAALGFGLCLTYRYTGSLYPCMVAHALNNCVAFAGLENWGWQAVVLVVCAIGAIGAIVMAFKRVGLIAPEPALPGGAHRIM